MKPYILHKLINAMILQSFQKDNIPPMYYTIQNECKTIKKHAITHALY